MDYILFTMSGIIDEPIKQTQVIERDAIIYFFRSYLENDILGTICNRHLALADRGGHLT